MRPNGPLRRPLGWVRSKNANLFNFLTTEKGGPRFVREILGVVIVVLVLVVGLWVGTGQSFPDESPVVVVESGSMMHCENGFQGVAKNCVANHYGRLGTIDPGDLILVKDIDNFEDIETLAGGDHSRYGKPGDVIVYYPRGDYSRTPIIHRALLAVELYPNHTVSIPALGIEHATRVDAEILIAAGIPASRTESLFNNIFNDCMAPAHGHPDGVHPEAEVYRGFITRGDNNADIDIPSIAGLCPVKTEWVLGISRGEIPWIGLVKLAFTQMMTPDPVDPMHYARAPGDLKTLMWITVSVIFLGPMVVDKIRARRHNAHADEEE